MSLWEKWEREKLRQKGFRVQEPKDVEIHESYVKPNIRKQIAIVLLACIGCLLLVLSAMLTEMMFTGRGWSNTYIVRLFATMQQARARISPQNQNQ